MSDQHPKPLGNMKTIVSICNSLYNYDDRALCNSASHKNIVNTNFHRHRRNHIFRHIVRNWSRDQMVNEVDYE